MRFCKKSTGLMILAFCSVTALHAAGDETDWPQKMFHPGDESSLVPDISDGYGVAFRDLNGDKLPDVYLVCFRSLNRLLVNRGRGGFFEDATIISGLGGNLMAQQNQNLELGAAVFDYDNDGDNDVMIGGWDITTRLYENIGDFTFREVRMNAFPEADMDINGVVVADVDRNGWLDLFLTDEHYTNRLFLQRSPGNFQDFTFGSGLESSGVSQGAAFCDVDLDGDPDLYVTNWFAPDFFYENLGNGRFHQKTIQIKTCQSSVTTNSASFCDIDHDGDFDLLVTNREGNSFLFRNDTAPKDTNWVFTDISTAWGLTDSLPAYSAVFADFDNDTWPDLFVSKIGPNRLYRNDHGRRFISVFSQKTTRYKGYSTGAACADYDGDGDLDLFVANKDTFAQFFVNPIQNTRAICLEIHGVRSNRDAIGTKVAIYPSGKSSPIGFQEVGSGNGYLSMNDLTIHFGLDTVSFVDAIVTYPSGRVVTVRHLGEGNYPVYEYPFFQRMMIHGVRHGIQLLHSRRFLAEVLFFFLYLAVIGVFLMLGLKRYAWQTGTLSIYLGGYLILAVSGLTLLEPLGRITAWMTIHVLTVISILIFLFYSEKNYRYRLKRKHYREVLIHLGEQVIQIHDDHALLEMVAQKLNATTEFSRCSIWILDADQTKISDGVMSGFQETVESLTTLNLVTTLGEQLRKTRNLKLEDAGPLAPIFTFCQGQILFPIVREERVYGFLALGSERPAPPLADEDEALFTTLTNQIAVALDNNAYIRESNTLVQQLTEANTREKYLKELEAANARLDVKNRELQTLYDELKNTEIQLIHSEKMASLGQLVAGISHELNNPVGFIYANVKQLKRYISRIEKEWTSNSVKQLPAVMHDVEGLIQDTIRGSQMVKTLVENLRQFSHLDQAEWKETDIHDGLASSLLILRTRLKDRIQVKTEYRATNHIFCNPGQINQVLVNMLANAAQAIRGEGVIRITTEDSEDGVIIQISDDGQGIPDEVLSKIFDPFFTTKPVGEGTGLGLSISYSIVQKHGGQIEVKSQVGQGSTFRIFLPINRKDIMKG